MPMLEEMAGRFPGVKIVIDHLGKPDLKQADPWTDFRKMFRLKRFPQVWVSASEPVYEEFGGRQSIWGTGYPRPRWELPMDKELEFVEQVLDFYSRQDRDLLLGQNALRIWKFPS